MPNNIPLRSGTLVHLSSDQAHYLTNVMRILKKRKSKRVEDSSLGKDCVRIFDGENGEWLAKVHISTDQQNESSSGRGRSRRDGRSPRRNRDLSLVAECALQLRTQNSEDDRPWVLFAPIRSRSRMKIMIEKCTELGVGRMIPVTSDRIEGAALMALFESNSKEATLDAVYGGYKQPQEQDHRVPSFGKLEVHAIGAAEQCERLSIPFVTNDLPLSGMSDNSPNTLLKVQDFLKEWCDDWEKRHHLSGDRDVSTSNTRVLLICRERASGADTNDVKARVMPVLQALRGRQRVSFLVGPEGGWSVEEEEMFDETCSKYGGDFSPVQSVSLGASVLRAETACVIAVGAWALMHDSK
eukprot:CAMPEP_0172529192 /NCGR_PEP_ID=MMETSP1067-20121228/3333_1 /TAXON_ID=265564 ORGANISM="Thalassiosira punctigera, Strain Tpunct2005C2" /NCGR_SAMPLE_ID=MMETSP1067 /ASSEMBLY_ACC=CAM_ASM_000444 /LENGTH=353 /DNA_ID=CAMNT_0013313197 /DNA_START=414 /DNA_END=1475 /DNA_ORIENTATION=-